MTTGRTNYSRIQVTIPASEADTVFDDILSIIPQNHALVATADSLEDMSSRDLIILTDDEDIEFMLKIKYAGCKINITRY